MFQSLLNFHSDKLRNMTLVGTRKIHTQSKTAATEPVSAQKPWVSTLRFKMAIFLSLGSCAMHAMNVNLSLAMICMLNTTAIQEQVIESLENVTTIIDHWDKSTFPNASLETANYTSSCKDRKTDRSLQLLYPGTVIWSPRTQGFVFSAFTFGMLAIVFTGWVADKASAKWLIGCSVFVAAGANVLTPSCALLTSAGLVIMLRCFIGLADATMQPTVNTFITRWYPQAERNTILSIVTGGRQIGTLIVLPLAGQLCAQNVFFNGWPSIFYLCGIGGVIWTAGWLLVATDRPEKHRWISEEEKLSLKSKLHHETPQGKRKDKKVPWCSILGSKAVWASVVSVICHEYPVKTLATFLPSYFQDVLRFNVQNNGFFSAIPILCFFITKITSSALSDVLQRKFNISKTTMAKIMNSIASAGLGGFLIWATRLDCRCPLLAVSCLSLGLASAGLHTPGCIGTLVSIAPAYSGTVTGLAYELAASSAILNVVMTKEIVQLGTREEWSIVFYIAAGVALLPLVVFNLWGSAEIQPFALESEEIKIDVKNDTNVVNKF